ncbi:fungal-specific transcription factor domain-containing protein [Pyrenochaeta sp. MPI-SDFR-AT-0127]|nr:fungal-specific transcription factor domain-containing protein [Pyrenochaeta sp. MPI-SDFR-AT-0127]
MEAQQQNVSDPQERPAKRTKIRLACQECRDRKIRCDGARPCNSCTRKKLRPELCIYSEPSAEVAPSYVKSLESRIRELEQIRGRSESLHQMPLQRDHTELHRSQGFPDNPRSTSSFDERDSPNVQSVTNTDVTMQHDACNRDTLVSQHGLERGQKPTAFDAFRISSSENIDHFGVQSNMRQNLSDAFAGSPPPHQLQDLSLSQQHPESFERAGFASLPPPSGSTPPLRFQHHRSQSNDLKNDQMNGQERLASRLHDVPEDEQVASAMGATEGTPPSVKHVGSVFLGPSSAAAFMNLVRQNSQKRSHSEVGGGTASTATSRVSRARSGTERELVRALMEDIVLPPRRIADEFLNYYWMTVHPLYPILHQPTFMKKYDRVWSDQGFDASNSLESVHSLRAFFSIFNAVLALGCRHSKRTNAKLSTTNSANTFFERSQQLITHESSDHGSLQLVQALVLAAQYLQGSDKINRCSCSIGLAIRVAQGIGIQLDDPCESQAEREERRRTWWCCVLMDRVLSMTFGRPPMVIWPSVVPFPAPVDDAYLAIEPSSAAQPYHNMVPSKIAFFIHALKLSDILIDVLKYFYTPRVEHREPTADGFYLEDCDPLLDLDNRLERWSEGLPNYLQYDLETEIADDQGTFRTQAITLNCRYLHLKILLFRPITVDLARSQYLDVTSASKRSVLKQAFATGCLESCVYAAQELIHVLSSDCNAGQLPVWWYSVFYLYTAGTVIVAVLLTPALQQAQQSNFTSLEASFSRCINALAQFAAADGGFAKNCLLILHTAYNNEVLANTQTIAQEGQLNARANSSHETTGSSYDIRASPNDNLDANTISLASNAFLDSFWPNGGLEWLNSVPMEFGSNAAGNISFDGY